MRQGNGPGPGERPSGGLSGGEVPTRPPWLAPAVALLAAALTAAPPVAAATARRGAPLLWRVEWYGRRSHLFGTVDRKSTRLNSSHSQISYAVFCLKKKKSRPASQSRLATSIARS